MNNDFNYGDQQYRDPFTNRPQYDFYDELVVKDAKKATSRSMLSLVFLTLVTYTLVYAAVFGLKFVLVDIMNDIDLIKRVGLSAKTIILPWEDAAIKYLDIYEQEINKKQVKH